MPRYTLVYEQFQHRLFEAATDRLTTDQGAGLGWLSACVSAHAEKLELDHQRFLNDWLLVNYGDLL
jgi:hypothetical protein